MLKTTYWYEVSVSKFGTPSSGAVKGLYGLGDKVHWVRKGEIRDTFAQAQADAIANGERPYRIKSETREEAFMPAEGSTILVPAGKE